MTQRLSRWLSATLGVGCMIWVITLAGCGGPGSTPTGEAPVEEPPPTAEYLKGEQAIQ